MEILLRILLFIASICFILLFFMFVLSFFVIFWPILVLSILTMTCYFTIRRYFFTPDSQEPFHSEKKHKSPIIEHREDDVE